MCLRRNIHAHIMNATRCSPATVTLYIDYFRGIVGEDIDVKWCVIYGKDIEVEVNGSRLSSTVEEERATDTRLLAELKKTLAR